MKHLFTLMLGMLMMACSYQSKAAFPLKTAPVAAQAAPAETNVLSTAAPSAAVQKQSVKRTKRVANTLPQVVYVLLAIFWLGWLAMGINDDFQGSDWLISLLLYIILYLPGLIFTLIKMGKYY